MEDREIRPGMSFLRREKRIKYGTSNKIQEMREFLRGMAGILAPSKGKNQINRTSRP